MLFLLLAAQAMSASPPERVDLTISQPCAPKAEDSGEVVVCANRNGESPYRLKDDPPVEEILPKAEVQVAQGASVSAETENADVGGWPSNRVMLNLKVKF